MGGWGRRPGIIGAFLLLFAATIGTASATDNKTVEHWHSRPVTYQILEKATGPTVSADRRTAVENAGSTWTANTAIDVARGTDINGSLDPAPYIDSSTHIVFWDAIPPEWRLSCLPGITIACTRWICGTPIPGVCSENHFTDADIVFETRFIQPRTWTTNCNTYDVETVALHEFGHFGGLTHTTDSAAVMYPDYRGCQRALTSHDIASGDAQYAGHP